MIRFTLPIRTESEMNNREHHHARADRATRHKEAVGYAITPRHVRPLLRVTLVRVANKELDGDNLQSSMKWIRDAIANAMRINDNSPLVEWEYGQAAAPPDYFEVRVAIDPVPPSDWSTPRPRSAMEEPVEGPRPPKAARKKKAVPAKFVAQPEETLQQRFARLARPAVYKPGGSR